MSYLTLEQEFALDAMLSGRNIFLTGRGGTGKSSIIRTFLERSGGNVACLAPTGIAARNLPNGVTIHNFFRLSPTGEPPSGETPYLQELYRTTDTILIDEISMVRSDLFSMMEAILRRYAMPGRERLPFGGKQIIVIGDFFQLPPVIEDDNIRRYLERQAGGIYAFNTGAWAQAEFENIVLEQVHRQTDPEYIKFLDAVRNTGHDLPEYLNMCAANVTGEYLESDSVGVCCTRSDVAAINSTAMNRLKDAGVIFPGSVRGTFPMNDLPTDKELLLKRGEKVMLLANQQNPYSYGYDYVNGDIGVVEDYAPALETVTVRLSANQRLLKVTPAVWFNYEYDVEENDRTGELRLTTRKTGHFRQLPLAPAYAMTIHKAQGQTLNRIHLVLGRGCFAHGQLYTALSRVRKRTDLTLDRPIRFREAMNDPQVTDFYQNL